MNKISFQLDTESNNHIYIDHEALEWSTWVRWDELVASAEVGGRREILTCSCGYATCGGLIDYWTFSGSDFVAWRTYSSWQGENYLFNKRQFLSAVYKALQELEWLNFYHGDDDYCPCAPDYFGTHIKQALDKAARVLEQLDLVQSVKGSTPTDELINAICHGDIKATSRHIAAAANLNNISPVPCYSDSIGANLSIIQLALIFAPAPQRFPITKVLVDHGADVNQAVDKGCDIFDDILATANDKIVGYLIPRFHNSKANHRKLQEVLRAESIRYGDILSRYCSRENIPWTASYPDTEANQWENIRSYKLLSDRLKLQSPHYLEIAQNVLA